MSQASASLLLLLCLVYATPPRASAAALVSQKSSVEHFAEQAWTTENGLPQNSVHQVLQTPDGYIWVATEGGVARFDGVQFTVFNTETEPAFTSNDVCCLSAGLNGTLWIGTADGLIRFAGGAFRRFLPAGGLPSPAILATASASDGALFVLTGGGVSKLQDDRFTPVNIPASAIGAGLDGTVWFATLRSGAFRYHLGTIQPVALDGYPAGPVDGVGALPDGSPWLRTQASLLLWRSGHLQSWPIPSRPQALAIDSSGTLWLGTARGLLQLAANPVPEPALAESSILSLFKDNEGNLWAGTDTAGLHILRRQRFRALPATSGVSVAAVTPDTSGTMWSGSAGQGLFGDTAAGQTRHFTTADGLLSNVILTLAAAHDGTLWIGTPDGLNHLHPNGTLDAITSADGLPDDLIRSLFADRDGTLWVGTRRGLAHLDRNRITILARKDGLGSDLIGTILRSRTGDLWVATLDGLTRLRDGHLTTFTRAQGISGDVITALLETPDGTLWVGTRDGGLSRSDASGGFVPVLAASLPVAIDAIVEDTQGDLWLASKHGVLRVSVADLKACNAVSTCNPRITPFSASDGMPSEEASSGGHPGASSAPGGELWFATRKGVAIVDPATLPGPRPPIPVVLEHVRIDDAEWPLASGPATIPPGHIRYAFEYAGLSFALPSKLRFRYRLDGFEKGWTDAGARRDAFYTNLPHGHYRFRVQATGGDRGLWSETSAAEFPFIVQPPFYRTPWFLALTAALLGALIFAGYRTRVGVLQSRFDLILTERNRIAREIHDTLAQGFVGVSVQLELTAHLLAGSHLAAATEQVDRTRALVREGLADARRSIWELRAGNTATLPIRLTELAERASTPHLAVRVGIGGTYRALTPAFEQEVLRIAQEALANVTRHSGATEAGVHLRYHPSGLTLSVADNGHGFPADDPTLPARGHFGLQGMRERAAEIGGTLSVESSPGAGTKVQLEAPLLPAVEDATHAPGKA